MAADEPVDSDVDLHQPGDDSGTGAATLGVVALGGALGALARYGAGLTWPTGAAAFPVSTFAVNVVGSALLGVLMVLLTAVFGNRPLLRPFLGTGVLGGFTTFSAYSVEAQRLIAAGRPVTALAYLGATLVCALLAVAVTVTVARRLVGGRLVAGRQLREARR